MYGLASIFAPPIITALLASLGVWWKERLYRRDLDNKRRRVLQYARDEVDAIDTWVKAYDSVASPELQAQAHVTAQLDLERTYRRLSESLDFSRGVEKKTTLAEHIRTVLMLGKLKTRSAKVARILYYAALCFAAIWAAVGSSATIGTQFTAENITGAAFMIFFGSILLPWSIYWLVTHLDKRLISRRSQARLERAFPPPSR